MNGMDVLDSKKCRGISGFVKEKVLNAVQFLWNPKKGEAKVKEN